MRAGGDSTNPTKAAAWTEAPLRILGVVVITTVLLTAMALAANTEPIDVGSRPEPVQESFTTMETELSEGEETTPDPVLADAPPAEPIRIPRPVLITLAVLAAIAAAYLLSLQRISLTLRRSKAPAVTTKPKLTAEEEATQIVEITRDLIDELQEGNDPRLAIQRAYAAVETGLGTDELARKPAETPLNYLKRVFGRNENAAPPLEALTRLFEVARFSHEPIDEAMRTEAIGHLAEIRERYKDQLGRKAVTFNTRAL